MIFPIALLTGAGALASCAYHFGLSPRALPGGYTQVAIPVFKNLTQETGVEMPFTNALIRRFAESQVARVTVKDNSPLVIEGVITRIETVPGPARTNAPNQLSSLPDVAVLTIQYRLIVSADVTVRRRSDEKVLWHGSFRNEIEQPAPQVGTPIVNSANATYNQSVRHQKISALADEMMAEAHDRMTENF